MNPSFHQNYKNIRPIDSVDSVSAILTNNNNESTSFVATAKSELAYRNNSIKREVDTDYLRYKSDNDETLGRRIPITPVITHYKMNTLDNKLDYIKKSLNDEKSNSKSLANSKRELNGDLNNSGLSTNGISLKIETPSSASFYQGYSNNQHASLNSSPWNQSPDLNRYDSNQPMRSQTQTQPSSQTQLNKFNGKYLIYLYIIFDPSTLNIIRYHHHHHHPHQTLFFLFKHHINIYLLFLST